MASVQDIYNEIDRINQAKGEIAGAIGEKGVDVPEQAKIDEYPGYVRQIQTGSPDAVLYTPQELTPEQQGQARENIGAGTYTKPNTGIPENDLAQGVQTLLEKANTAYQKPNGGIPKTDLATAVQNSLEKADTALQPAALTPITDLIPEQATPQNQLADKNFVNSSVATNTANYISDNGQPFQSLADLEAYSGVLTNNDYAFVVGTDAAGNTTYTRYKYNATTGEWAEEYVLNNSSFTAEQWAAISSGITALLVQKLSELPTEIVTYVAQTLTDAQKQQARTNIGATAPEIFWATYGVTTASQIDQAIADGKIVVCVYNGNYYYYSGKDSSYYYFFRLYSGLQSSQVRIVVSSGIWMTASEGVQIVSNRSQSVTTDRNNTTKYPSVKAVFDSLGKWGVISQTQTWNWQQYVGGTYTMSNQVWGLIPQASIDLYEDAGAVFNKSTGYFELNGLTDLSYKEIQLAYRFAYGCNGKWTTLYGNTDLVNARTTFPLSFGAMTNSAVNRAFTYDLFYLTTLYNMEVLRLTQLPERQLVLSANSGYLFYSGRNPLRKVIGALNVFNNNNAVWLQSYFFTSAYNLEELEIQELRGSISLHRQANFSLASVVYAVQYSANGATAITITLHPTAYARCQADTTEYTYGGNTYTGVIAYAAAKNITIASA